MWIATTSGFYSAVAHRDLPGHVMIRARAQEDLVNLVAVAWDANRRYEGHVHEAVTEADIVASRNADYPFRLTMSNDLWIASLEELARRIDYDNFKNAVAKVAPARAWTYHDVWAAFRRIEHEHDAYRNAGRHEAERPHPDEDWQDPDDWRADDLDRLG